MASYTEIKENEAQQILSLYGLNKILKMTPLSLGISNSNYRVELIDRVILLKISNDKNKKQLKDEQAILMYLHEANYPYSLCPLLTLNNELVYEFESFFGVIFPFVNGIPPGPSDATCFEVGKSLGELHSIRKPSTTNLIRQYEEVGFTAKEVKNYTKKSQCPLDFKAAFDDFFPDQLEHYLNSSFENGIIHGDLYYDNTLFHNNHLSTVLDFEQAGMGEYLLDLGISISGTCLEKGRIIAPLIESYLRGYESIRPLPETEKNQLDNAILIGLLSISLWRIKRFKEGNLNPLMTDSYQDLITRAINYKEYYEIRRKNL